MHLKCQCFITMKTGIKDTENVPDLEPIELDSLLFAKKLVIKSLQP